MARVIITQSLIVEDDFDDELIATEELRKIMADFLTTKILEKTVKVTPKKRRKMTPKS